MSNVEDTFETKVSKVSTVKVYSSTKYYILSEAVHSFGQITFSYIKYVAMLEMIFRA